MNTVGGFTVWVTCTLGEEFGSTGLIPGPIDWVGENAMIGQRKGWILRFTRGQHDIASDVVLQMLSDRAIMADKAKGIAKISLQQNRVLQ